jgi:spermidine synthase
MASRSQHQGSPPSGEGLADRSSRCRSTDGITTLRVDGKADASTSPDDMPTQMMLGYLPMLVHPDPRRVLVIGLGSGVTAAAVARHPIERLEVVEIEPAVVEASRFFSKQHGDVLKDLRVSVVIADARNFLLTDPRQLRCDRVRALQPLDGWHRHPIHAPVVFAGHA